MSSTICSQCNGTGWMPTTEESHGGVVRCECYKRERIPRLTEFAQIPPHYATATLENFLPANQSLEVAKLAAEHFVKEYPMAAPQGLMFMGPPGLGKTHLAIGIIQQLIRTKSVPCFFCDFPDLLREIQNSYNPMTQGSEKLILAPILDADVLVLDDLGCQKWSEWVQDMVAHVINDRYKYGHSTILTTNYLDTKQALSEPDRVKKKLQDAGVIDETGQIDQFKLQQHERVFGSRSKGKTDDDTLQDRIGDRLCSRLAQMCKTIRITGKDFRRRLGTEKIR